jgi:uncharacterized protein
VVKIGVIGNEEIDFICEKEGEKKYIQVALTINETKTMEREFGNLQKIPDNYPKEVITFDRFEGNSYQGITQVDIRTFLKS